MKYVRDDIYFIDSLCLHKHNVKCNNSINKVAKALLSTLQGIRRAAPGVRGLASQIYNSPSELSIAAYDL